MADDYAAVSILTALAASTSQINIYTGKHYQLHNAVCNTMPVQSPVLIRIALHACFSWETLQAHTEEVIPAFR